MSNPMNPAEQALKKLASTNPIETQSSATTAMKGYSSCRYCGASGNFSIYRGREWSHKKDCIWLLAQEASK